MVYYDARQLSEAVERYFRRNFALAIPVDFGWGLASALVAMGPIVTVLLQRLGADNALIALAPMMQTAGFALLQLPAIHLTRGLRAKKWVFISIHSCSLFWTLGGWLILAFGRSHPHVLVWILPLTIGLYAAGLGLAMPMWGQLLPRFFPDRRRGLVSGALMAASGVGGVVGGLLATWALGHWGFPRNFAYLFIGAGLTMAGSMTLYPFIHETVPPGPPPPMEPSLVRVVRRLWAGDPRLRRLTLVRYVSEFGAAGGAFLAVYALARFALPDRAAGGFSLALCLGQALGSLFMGRLGDRRGYRRVMGWGMICTLSALALALAARRPEGMYAVFALVGTAMAADWVSYVNLLVEMSDEATRGYYQALGATLALPPRLLGPIFWGWLGDQVGLPWVFAGALLLVATGWLLLVALVDDPRRPGQRVLRVAQGWRVYWR